MDLSYELAIAKELAVHAGKMALALKDRLTVAYKPGEEGPVTNADIAIDNYICQAITARFPNDLVIGEESYQGQGQEIRAQRLWLIDPIDGTTSYAAGMDDFVVMIGLAINGISRLGVVYQPSFDILWSGLYYDSPDKNFCERVQGQKTFSFSLAARPKGLMPKELSLIGSRTRHEQSQNALIRALNPIRVVRKSSVGLKAMMILEDQADIYVAWSRKIKLWDTCAPSAIVHAAGVSMMFIDGSSLLFAGPAAHGAPFLIASFMPNQQLLSTIAKIANNCLK